ncbi:MAG: hypothetical protein EXR72_08110 [Myxococcales bacterium]|nr:hypothetical protein [Myxococcales bacterium]
MKVVVDGAYARFLSAPDEPWWKGDRIKEVRFRQLTPGGRARVTLFEQVEGVGRPHPRFQIDVPPAQDPQAVRSRYRPAGSAPATATALREHLAAAFAAAEFEMNLAPSDLAAAPKGSERYFASSVRAQRTASLFAEIRAQVEKWLNAGALPASERAEALRAVRELEDTAYAGDLRFDDVDTGTYHSYQHDAPFVHYLERILDGLPTDGSKPFALLPAEQQESIRRQRDQAQKHLDFLMRHKYANDGIRETDIERSLGGFLIDRVTRRIVSETPASRGSLVPRYELLRIDPSFQSPHAGKGVHRAGPQGEKLRLDDGSEIAVPASSLRSTPVGEEALTFRRAPGDRLLRENVRFAWEGKGYVQQGQVSWVSWAGHCDIKAVMEQLGIAVADRPSLTEHRSESGAAQTYDRALLLEMIASVLELGSLYQRADGSGQLRRGITRFGGARNDGRPDRLVLGGAQRGPDFRWPLSGREETFVVRSIDWGEGPADVERSFFRHLPDLAAIDFKPNPRFLETVEGDYNLIDVSGARLEIDAQIDTIDPETGYPRLEQRALVLDLRGAAGDEKLFLGTQMRDAAAREIYRYYLDRKAGAIVAELDVWRKEQGRFVAHVVPGAALKVPLVRPLRATLGREMKQDDPSLFQALLGVAVRSAQNINADTTASAEVWNGVVTRIGLKKVAENRAARVERWQVEIAARFGRATLDYLMRRSPEGEPVDYCPLAGDGKSPDFLWQDTPDVGSKGFQDGDWIMNVSMLERDLIAARPLESAGGGWYVHDDHIKNVYELIYCALAGYSWTILHANKRHGFKSKEAWQEAIDQLKARSAAVRFSD